MLSFLVIIELLIFLFFLLNVNKYVIVGDDIRLGFWLDNNNNDCLLIVIY